MLQIISTTRSRIDSPQAREIYSKLTSTDYRVVVHAKNEIRQILQTERIDGLSDWDISNVSPKAQLAFARIFIK